MPGPGRVGGPGLLALPAVGARPVRARPWPARPRVGMDEPTAAAVSAMLLLAVPLRVTAMVVVTVVLDRSRAGPYTLACLVGGILLSLLELALRDAVAAGRVRWAAVLGAETAACIGMLLLDGIGDPFVCFSLGTAAVAAALYGVAGIAFAGVLAAASWSLAGWGAPADTDRYGPGLAAVGVPLLYLLAGTVLAVARRLHRQQVRLREALRLAARRSAAAQERARLARDMHDSLAKTLAGIGLTTYALRVSLERDAGPDELGRIGAELDRAAARAGQEARALLGDLRSDPGGEPLEPRLARAVRAWSRHSRQPVRTDLSPVGEVAEPVCRELVAVLGELLVNVAAHSAARTVHVALDREEDVVTLAVTDDGIGFAVPADLDDLVEHGHYGLVGVVERVRTVGGGLALTARPGGGTRVVVTVPAAGGRLPAVAP